MVTIECACRSMAVVDLDDTTTATTTLLQQCLKQRGYALIHSKILPPMTEWKDTCHRSFEQYYDTTMFTYRTSESGGTHQERKESLEVHPKQNHPLAELARKLHHVALQTQKLIGIPDDILLTSDYEHSIDLMRVFHYDTADDDSEALGSSPHTDWGSFTVVVQDKVGGLETYCRHCQEWIPVPPEVTVVHFGDAASLAMRDRAWPSPLHRVKSPKTQRRLSLVYFSYPPPQSTLEQVSQQLQPWTATLEEQHTAPLPLTDYYLLHNQKTGSTSYQETLDKYWNMTFQDMFHDKWQQVQR